MSAAASAAHPRVATKGWVRVPSSLIENQAVFTRAEMALALIVLRRAGGSDNVAVSISDENWTSWTGLGARLKEYAVAGLKQKCLQVSGRGDGARYSFAQSKWNTFVRHAGRSRPRTVGRKAGVTAKPGAKVHPECRERGCAMLQGASGCELIEFPNAQPVAQSGGELGDDHLGVPPTYQGIETPSGSTSAAQPVARSDPFPGSETPWPLALQELRKYFPLVEPGFVQKLAASVQREFKTVTDAELAQAVAVAHAYKHHYQKSEGLFLATVPSALRLLRRSPLSATRRNTRAAAEMLTDNFEKLAQLLEGQERFQEFAAELRAVGRLQPAKIEPALDVLRERIELAVLTALDNAQSKAVEGAVERAVLQHGRLMTEAQRDGLRATVRRGQALQVFFGDSRFLFQLTGV